MTHTVTLFRCHAADVLRVEVFARGERPGHDVRLGDLVICGAHAEDAHAFGYSAWLVTRTTRDSSRHACGTLHVFDTERIQTLTRAFAGPFTCVEWPCLLPQGHRAPHGGSPPPLSGVSGSHPQHLVMELATRLGTHGDPRDQLAHADAAFAELDSHMREGTPVPPCWRVADADEAAQDQITRAYDALSEALRETEFTVDACRAALDAASNAWDILNTALTKGSPLPQPWRRSD
ncbi:hypothetical protein J4H86_08745 [Spiractinospora alimapuensis]|uniref:hypothetical protein n=1 Tax=Spiractinospora alimapuensis TaxID=2820884 RepID=UPI001F3652F6|nr:hypothetical protein [Spiractinospora alimapuensis]QVQ53782.1 hypothetical protein J4H86_08745 [Spiractinospora alimapuensis]